MPVAGTVKGAPFSRPRAIRRWWDRWIWLWGYLPECELSEKRWIDMGWKCLHEKPLAPGRTREGSIRWHVFNK